MSKYTDELQTLILDHERTIDTYVSRLDNLDDKDPVQLMTKSQVEFLLLNVRSAKLQKEQELEGALETEKWRAQYPAPPQVMTRLGGIIDSFEPMFPTPPEGAVARVFYRRKDGSPFAMALHRFTDGKLIPMHMTEEWKPTDEWEVAAEQPVNTST